MTISIDLIKKLRDATLAPLGDCKEALTEAEGDIAIAQDILKKKWAIKADKKADRDTNAGVVKFVVIDGSLIGIKLLCETDFVSKNESFWSLVDQIIDIIASESSDIDLDSVSDSLMDRMTTVLKDNAVMIGENMRIAYIIKKAGNVSIYNHMGNSIASAIFYAGDDYLCKNMAKDCALQVAAMNPLYVSLDQVDSALIEKLTKEFTEEVISSGKSPDIAAKIVEWKLQKSLQDDVLCEQSSIKDPSKKIKELCPQWFVINSMFRISVW